MQQLPNETNEQAREIRRKNRAARICLSFTIRSSCCVLWIRGFIWTEDLNLTGITHHKGSDGGHQPPIVHSHP
jgi:hypothetical protein